MLNSHGLRIQKHVLKNANDVPTVLSQEAPPFKKLFSRNVLYLYRSRRVYVVKTKRICTKHYKKRLPKIAHVSLG